MRTNLLFRIVAIVAGVIPLAVTAQQEPPDTIALHLNEVEIVQRHPQSVRTGPGARRFSPAQFSSSLRVGGEADMLNHLKRLAGVTSAGDYGAGLIIDGAESSQTSYSIAGIPVIYPFRFGGLFSTFNSGMFDAVDFRRSVQGADLDTRIGSYINFHPFRSRPPRLTGNVNLGLLASSAALRVPVGPRFSVAAGARVSYVNRVYGPLLRNGDTDISYSFADFNLSANFAIDAANSLHFDAFHSSDRLGYDDRVYALDTRIRWRNSAAGLAWDRRTEAMTMVHRLYFSDFSSRMQFGMADISIAVPSSISIFGLTGSIAPSLSNSALSLIAGYELQHVGLREQSARAVGFGDASAAYTRPDLKRSGLARIYADAGWRLSHSFALRAGLSAAIFRSAGRTFGALDPRLTFIWYSPRGSSLALHAGRYCQFLHRVGFSDVGLASDFWMASGPSLAPQRAWRFALSYSRPILPAGLTLEADAYCSLVSGQSEYDGAILDLLNPDYTPAPHVSVSRGYNVGASLTLRHESPLLSASLSAGYGASRRRIPGSSRMVRGRHDPGASLLLTTDWHVSRHWSFGANFTLASGRVYTPVSRVYIIAGTMISEPGTRNSARLPAYHRLDLSATYRLESGRLHHLFNLSLINAYGRRNVELSRLSFSRVNNSYARRNVYSLYRFLPSLSYTLEF